ncbi:MAG TPA: hypothetical protein VFC46_12435 [Humisphaera sp.]|nr:hypothetical protein [Humisphaera sp.]
MPEKSDTPFPLDYADLDLARMRLHRRRTIAAWIVAILCITGIYLYIADRVLFPPQNRRYTGPDLDPRRQNLRKIHLACLNYTLDHNGRFPDELDVLLRESYLTADGLVCPDSADDPSPGSSGEEQAHNLSKGHHLSYVYVGKGQPWLSSNRATAIIAYERLNIHKREGSYFLFADGHLELLELKRAKALIAAIPTTQPTTAP